MYVILDTKGQEEKLKSTHIVIANILLSSCYALGIVLC